MRSPSLAVTLLLLVLAVAAGPRASRAQTAYALEPSGLFDGDTLHAGWAVVVRGDRIEAATSVNAHVPRLGDDVGRIRVGFRADLLAVSGTRRRTSPRSGTFVS